MSINGRVIKGDGYGKKLGFPTANIDRRQYVQRKLKIRPGVYAGTVTLPNHKSYKAGIVIGPLDSRRLPRLEAHLIGYKGNLYGKKITLYLYKFLRPFKTYRSSEMLKQQISMDIKRIKKLNFYG